MNFPPHAPNGPANDKGPSVAVTILVIVVVVVGLCAALAISGIRRFLRDVKEAEAVNALGQVAHNAELAYARDGKLCPSSGAPIPASIDAVRGKKYISTSAEWNADRAENAGFACLKFEMTTPQYYQYDYVATRDAFTVIARADFDGKGKIATWLLKGHVEGDHVVVDSAVTRP